MSATLSFILEILLIGCIVAGAYYLVRVVKRNNDKLGNSQVPSGSLSTALRPGLSPLTQGFAPSRREDNRFSPTYLKEGTVVTIGQTDYSILGTMTATSGMDTWFDHFLEGQRARLRVATPNNQLRVSRLVPLSDVHLCPTQDFSLDLEGVHYREVGRGIAKQSWEGLEGFPAKGRVDYVVLEADTETKSDGANRASSDGAASSDAVGAASSDAAGAASRLYLERVHSNADEEASGQPHNDTTWETFREELLAPESVATRTV